MNSVGIDSERTHYGAINTVDEPHAALLYPQMDWTNYQATNRQEEDYVYGTGYDDTIQHFSHHHPSYEEDVLGSRKKSKKKGKNKTKNSRQQQNDWGVESLDPEDAERERQDYVRWLAKTELNRSKNLQLVLLLVFLLVVILVAVLLLIIAPLNASVTDVQVVYYDDDVYTIILHCSAFNPNLQSIALSLLTLEVEIATTSTEMFVNHTEPPTAPLTSNMSVFYRNESLKLGILEVQLSDIIANNHLSGTSNAYGEILTTFELSKLQNPKSIRSLIRSGVYALKLHGQISYRTLGFSMSSNVDFSAEKPVTRLSLK